MSAEETKPGALPVEPAANEMDNAKTQEAALEVVPAAANGTEEVKTENVEASSSAPEKTASTQSDEATKLSDSDLEDKVVQDAVKQSRSLSSEGNSFLHQS